jgi:exodeoxyribonuclease V alpha subunit
MRERVARVFGEELPGPDRPGEGGVSDHIVHLVHSHRFEAHSGIGDLARAIQRGDLDAVLAVLHAPSAQDVTLVPRAPQSPALGRALHRAVVEGFKPFLRARTATEALGLLERYRVLAAHRQGPAGIESLNREIERVLVGAGLLPNSAGHVRRWYSGRPVLVSQNDYALRLFNGDQGFVWGPRGQHAERAYFAAAAGGVRELAPTRLPPHETAYAMSIHKSQGSELDEAALVLPDARSPLLTRELLYTAVTRARHRVVLYGSVAALRAAVARRVERSSGLFDRLRR